MIMPRPPRRLPECLCPWGEAAAQHRHGGGRSRSGVCRAGHGGTGHSLRDRSSAGRGISVPFAAIAHVTGVQVVLTLTTAPAEDAHMASRR